MWQYLRQFFTKPALSINSEKWVLVGSLIGIFVLLLATNDFLLPVYASIVIVYLLDGLVVKLQRLNVPHRIAVIIVYVLAMALLGVIVFGIFPLIWQQAVNFIHEIPDMSANVIKLLQQLPQTFPDYISPEQITRIFSDFKFDFNQIGKTLLSFSLSSIPSLITFLIYFILLPLLIYFFMMDKKKILTWSKQFLPRENRLLSEVWGEVHIQISNYIRGRVIEIIIVGLACYLVFAFLHLRYAALLAAAVGFSVIVPYIGAVVVTIPVIVVALLQWGLTSQFYYLLIIYMGIITVDANLLVPLLFSEVMNIHPIAIIVSVLFFGGIWGFWGVFFAIPLAVLVKAVLNILFNPVDPHQKLNTDLIEKKS